MELCTHVEEHSVSLSMSSKPYKCDFCYKVSVFCIICYINVCMQGKYCKRERERERERETFRTYSLTLKS